MKNSLQWRITIMTFLLIVFTCLLMQVLLSTSGISYMNDIESFVINNETKIPVDPKDVTLVISTAKSDFRISNILISLGVALLSGVLAYFVSGKALKPLNKYVEQVETVQSSNLGDVKLEEDSLTEFSNLSKSFNDMLDRLNQSFKAQEQFNYNVAHELKTPLALMQAQIESFPIDNPDIKPETELFLKSLGEQIERLNQMSKTLLEIANLNNIPTNEQIELNPLIEEIIADLSLLADKKNITLSTKGNSTITGSDTLIYQMIYNLVENAIKYNKQDGSVSININNDDKYTYIQVKDTGNGIPKEYQETIFQPFFRIDKSRNRQFGGVGLGLALVYEIAKLHKASVYVKDSNNNGTTIEVKNGTLMFHFLFIFIIYSFNNFILTLEFFFFGYRQTLCL